MNNPYFFTYKQKWLKVLGGLSIFGGLTLPLQAQIQSVTTVQHLSFGAFSPGSSGGTLTLSNSGLRSATGTVVPLNIGSSYQEAIFEVEAPQGTIISLLNGPDVTLSGPGGGTMSLHIGISDRGSSFISTVAPPEKTVVHVGGTLTVGNVTVSPPGIYSGSFYITFNNE
jgi:hypothetical protein